MVERGALAGDSKTGWWIRRRVAAADPQILRAVFALATYIWDIDQS
jgi:hypothetical protein